MLKVTGRGSITTCDGIARRDFLQVGTLGTIGLTLSKFAALQSLGATASGKDDKSCIMIFNLGAPSQLDTFDMKPCLKLLEEPPLRPATELRAATSSRSALWGDRKSTRLNSSHIPLSRMPASA